MIASSVDETRSDWTARGPNDAPLARRKRYGKLIRMHRNSDRGRPAERHPPATRSAFGARTPSWPAMALRGGVTALAAAGAPVSISPATAHLALFGARRGRQQRRHPDEAEHVQKHKRSNARGAHALETPFVSQFRKQRNFTEL